MHRIFEGIYEILIALLIFCSLYQKGISVETAVALLMLLAVMVGYTLLTRMVIKGYLATRPVPKKREYHPLVTIVEAVIAALLGLLLVKRAWTYGFVAIPKEEAAVWELGRKWESFAASFNQIWYYFFAASIPTCIVQKERGYLRCGILVIVADVCLLSGFLTESVELPVLLLKLLAILLTVYYPVVLHAQLRREKYGVLDKASVSPVKLKMPDGINVGDKLSMPGFLKKSKKKKKSGKKKNAKKSGKKSSKAVRSGSSMRDRTSQPDSSKNSRTSQPDNKGESEEQNQTRIRQTKIPESQWRAQEKSGEQEFLQQETADPIEQRFLDFETFEEEEDRKNIDPNNR